MSRGRKIAYITIKVSYSGAATLRDLRHIASQVLGKADLTRSMDEGDQIAVNHGCRAVNPKALKVSVRAPGR